MLRMSGLQHVPSGDVEGRYCEFDVVVAELVDALTKLHIVPAGNGVNAAATVRTIKVANAKVRLSTRATANAFLICVCII